MKQDMNAIYVKVQAKTKLVARSDVCFLENQNLGTLRFTGTISKGVLFYCLKYFIAIIHVFPLSYIISFVPLSYLISKVLCEGYQASIAIIKLANFRKYISN